jgi:hypothetical protein
MFVRFRFLFLVPSTKQMRDGTDRAMTEDQDEERTSFMQSRADSHALSLCPVWQIVVCVSVSIIWYISRTSAFCSLSQLFLIQNSELLPKQLSGSNFVLLVLDCVIPAFLQQSIIDGSRAEEERRGFDERKSASQRAYRQGARISSEEPRFFLTSSNKHSEWADNVAPNLPLIKSWLGF